MRHQVCLVLLALTVAVAGRASVLYVDAGSGSDSNAGSLEAPWQTIQHGVDQLAPGDALVVRPGIYVESVDLAIAATATAPVEIRGEPGAVLSSPNPSASLSAFDVAASASDLDVSGFEIRGGYHEAIFIRPGASRIAVRRCDLHENRAGIWVSGGTNIEIDSCTISGSSSSGVRIFGGSTEVLVTNTLSHHNDDGLGCDGDADGFTVEQSASRIQFAGCRSWANSEDGFDLQGDAISLAAVQSTGNGCAGVKVARNATITNSIVAANRTGITTTSLIGADQGVVILNSVVADNTGTQIVLRNPPVLGGPLPVYTVLLRNVVAAGPGKALEVEAGIVMSEDHNIFYRPHTNEGLIVVHRPDTAPRRYSGQEINSGLWAAESGGGMTSWALDPDFSGPDDYHLAPSSAAIDSGSALGAPGEDIDGTPRPRGWAVDRGAYESVLAVENHAPWPDPGPPREVRVGATITLSAYGSFDPDGDPLAFTWRFDDDGHIGQGGTATHDFNQLGETLVSLSAFDGSLEATRTTLVRVVADWSTPTATPTSTATATATETSTARPTATPTPTTRMQACGTQPRSGCLLPATAVCKATDRRPPGPSGKDRLVWKWLGGPEMLPGDFGEPDGLSTAYRLCVYDDSGLQAEVAVDTPGSCANKPCWKANRSGYRFRDGGGDGVRLLKLKAARAGKSKIVLVARGPSSYVDRSKSLIIQLLRSDSLDLCWQTAAAAR